jgi:hypothetical protein
MSVPGKWISPPVAAAPGCCAGRRKWRGYSQKRRGHAMVAARAVPIRRASPVGAVMGALGARGGDIRRSGAAVRDRRRDSESSADRPRRRRAAATRQTCGPRLRRRRRRRPRRARRSAAMRWCRALSVERGASARARIGGTKDSSPLSQIILAMGRSRDYLRPRPISHVPVAVCRSVGIRTRGRTAARSEIAKTSGFAFGRHDRSSEHLTGSRRRNRRTSFSTGDAA